MYKRIIQYEDKIVEEVYIMSDASHGELMLPIQKLKDGGYRYHDYFIKDLKKFMIRFEPI